MTDRVFPSLDRTALSREFAAAIRYAGSVPNGWIVPSADDPGNIATDDSNITEGNLNAFAETSTTSSFDVTIDAGQAYVGGAWLARDTSTTVTLSSSTNGQSVYVGWDVDTNNTVLIGKSGAFDADDPKHEIWTFDTDGSGVTSATDKRRLDGPGSVNYVQDAQPTSVNGATWIAPGTGIFHVGYDDGSGVAWHSVPPVTVTNETTDFNESGVTVTTNGTTVSSGSAELKSSTVFGLPEITLYGSLDVSGKDTDPRGMTFNGTGSKVYFVGRQNAKVYSYDLSTNYDLTTATFNQSYSFTNADADQPESISWNDTGSKMFTIDQADYLVEFTASTNYDISTLSFSHSEPIVNQDFTPKGMAWKPDGTKFYMVGQENSDLYEYSVSTAYDASTLGFQKSANVGTEDTNPTGIAWNDTGSKLFLAGSENDNLYEYTLSTDYDISTLSYSRSVDVSSEDGSVDDVQWDPNGLWVYQVGSSSDSIYQYGGGGYGEVLVEWGAPTDLSSWDLATFQRTLNSETVEIDVEQDDGTNEFSDIGQNFDISTISDSVTVQLRANLFREATSNNPTIDYLARRYLR